MHQPARGPSGTVLRVLFYPPLSQPSAAAETRAAAHSDYGSLTLLFRLRGQPGLEVRGPNGGPWMPVPVCPPGTEADAGPPVLVNIGDLLSYWTNGLLRSTLHRVVLPAGAEARYSIAFFCHPAGATRLEAVPSDRVRAYKKPEMGVGEDEDLRRESVVMTADEHLQMRLKETYSHLYGGKA